MQDFKGSSEQVVLPHILIKGKFSLLTPMAVILALILSCMSALPVRSEEDPLEKALAAFESLDTYTTILNSYAGGKENIRYFFKKPGFIRMEFIRPHKGAFLAYNPNTGKVRLRPFGLIKPLIITLSPGNRLIRSPRGHTVDRSHLGALIDNALRLEAHGSVKVLGREEVHGREAIKVEVSAREGFESDGVNRHLLWLDTEHFLPIRAEGYDAKGMLIEGVFMDELTPGAFISNTLFTP